MRNLKEQTKTTRVASLFTKKKGTTIVRNGIVSRSSPTVNEHNSHLAFTETT
jgi:hypothetical protein